MFTKLYFCLFCPLKTNDVNNLKKHLFNNHFEATEDKNKRVLKKWINSLVEYQTELNVCLSSDPKSLPKSSMCQSSAQNNTKQKLLKGCLFCDKIIDYFKLDVIRGDKKRNECVCGSGIDTNKVVVKCIQCKHLYHYQCVEPTGYSGEETSLYKCFKCKEKDFEISDLSSESKLLQPFHVSLHFNYQPYVCKICNDSHFQQNFLKTHLKSEHNLKPNDIKITNYYTFDPILKVQQLIDNCLKKLDQNNSSNQLSAHLSQTHSKQKQSIESNLNSMKRKTFGTNEDNHTFNSIQRNELRGSREQTTTRFQNDLLNKAGSSTDPSLSSPPILVNEKNFNNSTKRDSSQMPKKRGRGRPRKSETTIEKRPKYQTTKQSNDSNFRTFITPNSYVADGNPQHKSRLSKESRLSRPNIRLSREQEKALHNKTIKTKITNKSTYKQYNNGGDSSEWDSDIEHFETNLPFKTIPETSDNQMTQNENRRQSYGSISNDNQDVRSAPNVDVLNEEQNQEMEVLTNDQQMDQDFRPVSESQLVNSEDMAVQTDDNSITIGSNNTISVLSKDWLTHTKPKKFPYFPQINDEVVYIPYGHKAYMETVQKDNLYRQYKNNKYINSNINDIFYAKVKDIEFKKNSNIRLAKLSLTLVNSENENNRPLTVKFHDIDNIVDFIVLKQIYDNSIERNWKIGDSFRAIIEDKWWFGDIQSYSSDEHNTKTYFQCLKIIWGNGSNESLSLWDLEPIIGEMPKNKSDSIDVTDEDRNQFYISDPNEWPSNGKREECKRIVKGLNQIIKLKEYKELIEVFDPSNQEFVDKVPYLINLDIIRSRVQNMFYRRHAAIKYDIKFLESNASILEPKQNNGVLRNARIVVSVCLKFIDNLKATDIHDIYSKVLSEPNNLSKIKYYTCVRSNLKSNSMTTNASKQNERQLNLLTPSTSNTRVNTIHLSDDNQIQIIDLSDSEEDNNEEQSQQRVQRLVEQMEEHIVSPTAPDSPSPRSLPESLKTLQKTSKPVVPVRALPKEPVEEEEPPQEVSNEINHYFCVFCLKTFADKNQAMDHYWTEFKIKLKCSYCPQNTNFQTYDHYFEHNSQHIKQSFDQKSFQNIKTWIQSIIGFMDDLTNQMRIQNQIHQNFGDYCNVCKGLNLMTADSQPLFHKSVFSNNRKALNLNIRTEISKFTKHLRQHFRYEPYFYCIQCTLIKPNQSNDIFKCDQINDKCRQHLQNEHQMEFDCLQDITPFFGDTDITNIKDLISNLTNICLINCSHY